MSEAKLIVRNMRQFRAELLKRGKTVRGAGETAVKVEGYRLMLLLRKELRQGKAGSTEFPPLRVISRGQRSRKPLSRLAKAVRYAALGRGAHLRVMIGFLFVRSSRAWVRIARRLQEGYTTPASAQAIQGRPTSLKQFFIRRGVSMGARSKLRKYFFLRKATTTLTTPPRPIIDPFWRKHQREAERNIIRNFRRKLAGERI